MTKGPKRRAGYLRLSCLSLTIVPGLRPLAQDIPRYLNNVPVYTYPRTAVHRPGRSRVACPIDVLEAEFSHIHCNARLFRAKAAPSSEPGSNRIDYYDFTPTLVCGTGHLQLALALDIRRLHRQLQPA
jgi:hypothetical protein